MSKHEIQSEAYIAQHGKYLYQGFDADQWAAMEQYDIAEALEELDFNENNRYRDEK